MAYPYEGILLSCKKEIRSYARYHMEEPRKHYTKQNKLDTTEQVFCNSTYMKYLEQASSQRQKADKRLPGAGREEEGMGSAAFLFRVRASAENSSDSGCTTLNAINAPDLYTQK